MNPVLAASIAGIIIISISLLLVSGYRRLLEAGTGAGEMHLRLCLPFGITKIACYSSFNRKVTIKLTKVNTRPFSYETLHTLTNMFVNYYDYHM